MAALYEQHIAGGTERAQFFRHPRPVLEGENMFLVHAGTLRALADEQAIGAIGQQQICILGRHAACIEMRLLRSAAHP